MQFNQWLPGIRVVTIEGSAIESLCGDGKILYLDGDVGYMNLYNLQCTSKKVHKNW